MNTSQVTAMAATTGRTRLRIGSRSPTRSIPTSKPGEQERRQRTGRGIQHEPQTDREDTTAQYRGNGAEPRLDSQQVLQALAPSASTWVGRMSSIRRYSASTWSRRSGVLAPVSKSTLLDGPEVDAHEHSGRHHEEREAGGAVHGGDLAEDQGEGTVRGFSRPGHGDAEVAQEVEHFSGGGGRTGSGSGTGEAASGAIRRAATSATRAQARWLNVRTLCRGAGRRGSSAAECVSPAMWSRLPPVYSPATRPEGMRRSGCHGPPRCRDGLPLITLDTERSPSVSTFFTGSSAASPRARAYGPAVPGAAARRPFQARPVPYRRSQQAGPRNQSEALLTTEPPTRLRSIRPALMSPSRPQAPSPVTVHSVYRRLTTPDQGGLDRLEGRPPLLRHRAAGSPGHGQTRVPPACPQLQRAHPNRGQPCEPEHEYDCRESPGDLRNEKVRGSLRLPQSGTLSILRNVAGWTGVSCYANAVVWPVPRVTPPTQASDVVCAPAVTGLVDVSRAVGRMCRLGGRFWWGCWWAWRRCRSAP